MAWASQERAGPDSRRALLCDVRPPFIGSSKSRADAGRILVLRQGVRDMVQGSNMQAVASRLPKALPSFYVANLRLLPAIKISLAARSHIAAEFETYSEICDPVNLVGLR